MTAARPPRESATVILARDADAGLEVFMVRRHLASDFVGGAYVFPGGALDQADCEPRALARYEGLSPEDAGRRMKRAPERAIGHWGCAIRETFEEAGVLLAYRQGALVDLRDRSHWSERRRQLLDGDLGWLELLEAEDLRLALDRLYDYAHWTTPEGQPKRFTTRFFVAELPEGQAPLADDREVSHGVWVRPEAALAAHARGEMTMILPTLRTLEELSAHATVADVLAEAAGREIVDRLPRPVMRDGRPVLLLPGDAGYEEAAGLPPAPFDPTRR